jgi:hypothetical protein
MKQIELSAGTIEYHDTGGDGPVLVLLHGLMMDASLWDGPIADLAAHHRCIAPTLPLGAHRHAMLPGADLSLPGIARLTAASYTSAPFNRCACHRLTACALSCHYVLPEKWKTMKFERPFRSGSWRSVIG